MMILSYLKNTGVGFNTVGFAGRYSAAHKKSREMPENVPQTRQEVRTNPQKQAQAPLAD